MATIQIIIIAVMAAFVGFLTYLVVKSILSPKKIEGIQKLIKQGKYGSAVKLAKNMITKNPRDFKAHYFLGKAYLAENKPELALMEYKIVNQTAIFDETFGEREFRKQIAQLYYKFNQPEEALKEYLLLTKLEPNVSEHFYNAGKLFENRQKSDQALSFYQQAIKLDRRNIKAHASLGLLLFRAKQYGEAKKEIDLAISLSPETYSSYYYLGKILKEGKDYSGAINAFEKALRDPEFKQRALIERGSCYLAVNAIDKAIIEFDRAVSASADDSTQESLYARYFLATCYEKDRKIDLALQQWEKIYHHNHTFRDVPAKLAQYKDLQANDNMKEFLTSNTDFFIDICKKIALSAYNMEPRDVQIKKYGCKFIATESKAENWQNVRQQVYVMIFYREPDLIEDSLLRQQLEEMKKQNYFKCILCTSSGFTRPTIEFAENRPFELVGKDKLEKILSNISF